MVPHEHKACATPEHIMSWAGVLLLTSSWLLLPNGSALDLLASQDTHVLGLRQ